jgi:hypothetical protein
MRKLVVVLLLSGLCAATGVMAQPPGGKGKNGDKGPKAGKAVSTADLVARMMTFDANKDGKLSKEEVTDARLHRLFDRADADKDGFATKDELTALFTKEGGGRQQPMGGPPGGGPDRFPGRPPGGFPGGPGGFGPPRPGQILPEFLQEMLELTDAQKKQLAALQKEVDAKLAKILTPEQKKQLDNFRPFGPGGPGDRPDGDDGPPPGKKDGPPGRKGKKGGPPGVRGGNEDPLPEPTPLPMPRTVAFSKVMVRAAVTKALPPLWKHVAFLNEWIEDQRDNLASGRGPGPFPTGGGVDTTGYVVHALSAIDAKPSDRTAVVADYTLGFGQGSVHWFCPADRRPRRAAS